MRKFNCMKSIILGFFTKTYQSSLEEYIQRKNPKTIADIEKYTLEYERSLAEQTFKF